MFSIGLSQLAKLVSIDVGEIGVGGAKDFFQAKIHMANRSNKFEEEVRLGLQRFCWFQFSCWSDQTRAAGEEEGAGGEEEEAGGVQEQASQLCLSFFIGIRPNIIHRQVTLLEILITIQLGSRFGHLCQLYLRIELCPFIEKKKMRQNVLAGRPADIVFQLQNWTFIKLIRTLLETLFIWTRK